MVANSHSYHVTAIGTASHCCRVAVACRECHVTLHNKCTYLFIACKCIGYAFHLDIHLVI